MSGQLAQTGAHDIRACGMQEPFDPRVLTFPDRRRGVE
jgi:hypothetical protein